MTFGKYGGVMVMLGLSTELFLALTSFLINIGLNITILNPKIDSSYGILIGGFISILLSFLDLKYASYSSLLGVCLTSLLLIALLIAGNELPKSDYSIHSQYFNGDGRFLRTGDSGSMKHPTPVREYNLFVPSQIPISLGLIAFCFGGIGAL